MSAEAGKPYEWGGLGDSPELTPEKIDAIVSDPAAFVEEVERWTEPREDGPMTLTLPDFLLARIAEDEEVAKAASPGPWHLSAERDEVLAVDGITVCDAFALSSPQVRATAEHIARHDPARVLAECAAKRLILRIWFESEFCERDVMNDVIDALALPYADHPDYREEWRP